MKIISHSSISSSAVATPPIKDVLDSGEVPDSSVPASPLPADQPTAVTDEAPGPEDAGSRLNEENAQSVTSLSKTNTHSPGGNLSVDYTF